MGRTTRRDGGIQDMGKTPRRDQGGDTEHGYGERQPIMMVEKQGGDRRGWR